jgi:two-component system sensor histidine kinase BaeS
MTAPTFVRRLAPSFRRRLDHGRAAALRPHLPRRIGARIAIAAILVAVSAVAILATGTLVLGAQSMVDLMTADGHPASEAQAMFDSSVGRITLLALIVAVAAGAILSAVLAARIARPLREVGAAARRIAGGDYAARVPREGPEEVADLADSFNQMAASLEEQERIRRELIGNAAHELRTPLTNLQGYLEALRDEVIPADRATFESLWEEAQRLVRLSRSLDVLAEGDTNSGPRHLAEVNLPAAIRSAAELAGPAMAQSGIKLDLSLPESVALRTDPDALAQILANLFQNAARYTPAGGMVRVRLIRGNGRLEVSIENTGPGIPAADLPHVFERFYRVEKSRDAARGGAGIGLAIVRELVEALGGTVGAESRDGLTRFWFRLDATYPQARGTALKGPP